MEYILRYDSNLNAKSNVTIENNRSNEEIKEFHKNIIKVLEIELNIRKMNQQVE